MNNKIPLVRSHWHEPTEKEKQINEIFKINDVKLERFLELYQKFDDKYRDEIDTKTDQEKEEFLKALKEMASLCMNDINKSVISVGKIWEEWFKKNEIFKYFHEIWGEPLYLVRFILEQTQKIMLSEPKFSSTLSYKTNLYWHIHSLIINISSAFDKIANIYVSCNCPVITKEEVEKEPKFLKKIESIKKNLYFDNIDESLTKILEYSISDQNFLIFNKKVTSTSYWREIHKQTRNDFIHGYFGYYHKFSASYLTFILVDLYLLLRSLWFVSVINWNILEALNNIYSRKNDLSKKWFCVEEVLKNNSHFLDHYFSQTIIDSAGSGVDDINIVSWTEQ